MLPQVFNLPIEEAAKHLGIGQTMLKHYCRKFGIPRWPYRKRQSVVQLISSIEGYSTVRAIGCSRFGSYIITSFGDSVRHNTWICLHS
jgi:hypothetical protein